MDALRHLNRLTERHSSYGTVYESKSLPPGELDVIINLLCDKPSIWQYLFPSRAVVSFVLFIWRQQVNWFWLVDLEYIIVSEWLNISDESDKDKSNNGRNGMSILLHNGTEFDGDGCRSIRDRAFIRFSLCTKLANDRRYKKPQQNKPS